MATTITTHLFPANKAVYRSYIRLLECLILLTCSFSFPLSAQNVGIGTTTPTEKLDVQGNARVSGVLNAGGFKMPNGTNFMVDGMQPGTRFNINESGFVGIGINPPESALDVNGAVFFRDILRMHGPETQNCTITNVFGIRGHSTGGLGLYGGFNQEPNMFIANNGRVGVGTQTPSQKLEVNGNIKVTGIGEILLENSHVKGINTLEGANDLFLRGNPSNPISITVAGNTGNVGIGTATPTEKLEVAGNLKTSNDLLVGGNGFFPNNICLGTNLPEERLHVNGNIKMENSHVKGLNTLEGANDLFLRSKPGNDITLTVSGNNGFVGINTTGPSKTLDVNGTTKTTNLQLTAGAANGHILQSDGSGNATWVSPPSLPALGWSTSGNDVVSSVSGNVGVGIATPSEKLEVAGNIKASNNLVVDGIGFFPNNICLGTNLPEERLHVNGNIKMENSHIRGLNTLEGANDLFLRSKPGNDITLTVSGNNGFVGINTTGPSKTLDVNGTTKTTNLQLTAGALNGHVLQSDGSGNASWVSATTLPNGNWNTTGDNQSSSLSGNVGIGTATPSEKLQVNGNIKVGAGGQIVLENSHINGLNTLQGANGLYLRANPGNGSIVNIDPNGSVGIGIGTSAPVAKLQVNGDFTASGTKSFTIDHPLDPANKTLQHACIESNEVLNIYSGTVTLGAGGKAIVQLPDYFEALNKDFRYQLTCIGGFAQVYIEQEVYNNQFAVAGGTPGLKVSWQVTGVRNDPWCRDRPYQPVQEKPEGQKGRYFYPQGYGQSASKGLGK